MQAQTSMPDPLAEARSLFGGQPAADPLAEARAVFEEPVVDQTEAGLQPRLPGDVGAVRNQNIMTPEFEAPFSLTAPKGPSGNPAQPDILADARRIFGVT